MADTQPIPTPKTGEQTAAQAPKDGGGLTGATNADIPGLPRAKAGDYALYRKISGHPTVAEVVSLVKSPIAANTWGTGKRKGTPARIAKAVEEAILPLRADVILSGLTALDMGWMPFEVIWDQRDGLLVPVRFKPLRHEWTKPLVDAKGNLVGVENKPEGQDAPIQLVGPKAFVYTYDAQDGDPHGRSRHENIRQAWTEAEHVRERFAKYLRKVSGVTVQLHYPKGVSKDASGAERPNQWLGQSVIDAVSEGRSVMFPNLFASEAEDNPLRAADLAGKSQWVLSTLDTSGSDQSGAFTSALMYYDKLLFRGWLRPERAGLEGTHGTRADAKTHTDNGIVDCELIEADFVRAFNRQVVDAFLVLNFGEKYRGAVTVDASPISSNAADLLKDLLQTALQSEALGEPLARKIDWDSLLDDADLPIIDAERGPIDPLMVGLGAAKPRDDVGGQGETE